MVTINADDHPGLHRYSLELAKYPELSEEQYASVLSDLKQPEKSVLYQNARAMLICSHLAMILGMAKDTYRRYYGLSMEDYVGLGNVAMVTKFSRFKPGQKVPFSSYLPWINFVREFRKAGKSSGDCSCLEDASSQN